MQLMSGRPDIWPDNPAFLIFGIGIWLDTGFHCRISGEARYRISGQL
jgi:hypothetical protein